MGMFKNMKDAMGQAAGAQQAAGAAQQQAGGMSGLDMGSGLQARGALEGQAHEQNRILSIGSPGSATIKGHVDTGEQVAGNPVWMLDLEITPEGWRRLLGPEAGDHLVGGHERLRRRHHDALPDRPGRHGHDRVRRQAVHVAWGTGCEWCWGSP